MTEMLEYLRDNPWFCGLLILALLFGWWLGELVKGREQG